HCLGQGSTDYSEVLRKYKHATSVDLAVPGDHGIAEVMLLIEAELSGSMYDQLIEFFEGTRIQQQVEAFPGCEFSSFVLGFNAFQAAAQARLILHLQQLLETLVDGHRDDTS